MNEIFVAEDLVALCLSDDRQPLELSNLSWPVNIDICRAEGPLVTVIIPAFNAERTISVALEGLISQTWKVLEIIIVDDCSSDATASIVNDYAKRDCRIRLVSNKINLGTYPTRNVGLALAQGSFITVHDSDDWSHPQKIECQLNALLEDSSTMGSISFWTRVTPDLRFLGSWLLNERFIEKNHSSALFRREVFERLGFWDPVSVAADSEFLWRTERSFGKDSLLEVLPEVPLSFALELSDSLTRTKSTHVRTIHFGLRRLYREAARWWHSTSNDLYVAQKSRMFPIPLGMDRESSRNFDTVFVSDFSTEGNYIIEALAYMKLELSFGKTLTLLHWPDYTGWHEASISPEVFDFCQVNGLQFAHAGLDLVASELVFINSDLWRFPIDEVPKVLGLKAVRMLFGDLEVNESKLLCFFQSAGRDSVLG